LIPIPVPNIPLLFTRFIGWLLLVVIQAMAGPMVHHIEAVNPRAGQRGTTADVTLEGAYIKEPREVLFFRPGIRCVSVEALPSLEQPRQGIHSGFTQDFVKCRFEIAASVQTPHGQRAYDALHFCRHHIPHCRRVRARPRPQ
jgi:hypothetical protein